MGRIKDVEKILQNAKEGNCIFCNKVCKNQNSLRQHQIRCKCNPNRRAIWLHNDVWRASVKNRKVAVQVKDQFICKFCKKCWLTTVSGYKNHELHCRENPCRKAGSFTGRTVSEETKKKISATGKSRKSLGGYRFGSGRGKKGTYKGYYCDSSWELAYVIFNLEHNIKFERNEELFPYEFNGEQHKYKPDFIEGNTYVEVKGYYTEQVNAKTKAFPYKLKFLDKETIKPYIDYVISKYGQDFIRLYE